MEAIVQNQKITSAVSLPGLVVDQLLTNDDHEILAGKLREKEFWIAKNGSFSVLTSDGKLVASKTFASNIFQVSCAAEYNTSIVFLGLQSESGTGCIGLYNLKAGKVQKTWELGHKVTSLTLLKSEASTLKNVLGLQRILLVVGSQEGHILLLALTTGSSDQEGRDEDEEADSDDTSVLTYLGLNDLKQDRVWPSNADLALPLNDSSYYRNVFICGNNKNDPKLPAAEVSVTSLCSLPATESLLVGFSFGGFQIWNLETLTPLYASPFSADALPVVSFVFQEPEDDPRNFCYVWVVQSEAAVGSCASMYSLGFARKFWDAEGKAYYEDLQSCNLRLEIDVDAVFSDMDLLDQGDCKLISSSSIQPPPFTESDESRSPVLSQSLFVWEVKGESISYYATLFDLNQWYHAQMPNVWKFEPNVLCPFLGFFHIQLESYQRVISAWPKNDSLAWFETKAKQEEFSYPSALAYDLVVLVRGGILTCKFVGLQLSLLNKMKTEGPVLLLQPSDFYCKAIKAGLLPEATDLLTQKGIREILLTMALDYGRLPFLKDCVAQWADGSYTGSGCSLAFLDQWAWASLAQAKQAWDTTSSCLYDESNELDDLKRDELHAISAKVNNLATLLSLICDYAKKRYEYDNLQMECKVQAAELIATFCKTVLWFVYAGLLPEHSEEAGTKSLAFPTRELTEYYTYKRRKLEQLSSNVQASDVLLVDVLVSEGENSLGAVWKDFGGKSDLYPPPSYEALLAGYLNGEVDVVTKHRVIQYLFLDLASIRTDERYLEQIEHLITFPSSYSLSPSVIKLTQAFWLLDHQDFEESLTVLLDPLVLPTDITPEQHKAVVKAFLYQGHPRLALKYSTLRKIPNVDVEQTRLHLTVLLACGLITDALQYRRIHASRDKDQDLLHHFFEGCHELQKLHLVLQLPLNADEEESLIAFLSKINTLSSKELLLMFYLQRSRFAEVNALHIAMNRGWPAFDPWSKEKQVMRNTIVSGYLHVLPQLTTKLATLPTTQLTNTTQEKRPYPLSKTVKPSSAAVYTNSGLICQALEKARATWSRKAMETQTPFRKRKTVAPTLDSVPFLCSLLTPRGKDTSMDANDEEVPNAKRQRLSHHEPAELHKSKRLSLLSEEVRTLLRTPPVVKRKNTSLYGTTLSISTTPHSSILKAKPASFIEEDQEASIISHVTETSKQLRFELPRPDLDASDATANQTLASVAELDETLAEVSMEQTSAQRSTEESLNAITSANQSAADEFVSFEDVSGSNKDSEETHVSIESEQAIPLDEDSEMDSSIQTTEDRSSEVGKTCTDRLVEEPLQEIEEEEDHIDSNVEGQEELEEDEEEEQEEEDLPEETPQYHFEAQRQDKKSTANESDDDIVVLSSSDEEEDSESKSSEAAREDYQETVLGQENEYEEEFEEDESEEDTTSEDSCTGIPVAVQSCEQRFETNRIHFDVSECESEETEQEHLAEEGEKVEDYPVAEADENTMERDTSGSNQLKLNMEESILEEESPKDINQSISEEPEVLNSTKDDSNVSEDIYEGLEDVEVDQTEPEAQGNESNEEAGTRIEETKEPQEIIASEVTETVVVVEKQSTSQDATEAIEEHPKTTFDSPRLVFSEIESEGDNEEAEKECNEELETGIAETKEPQEVIVSEVEVRETVVAVEKQATSQDTAEAIEERRKRTFDSQRLVFSETDSEGANEEAEKESSEELETGIAETKEPQEVIVSEVEVRETVVVEKQAASQDTAAAIEERRKRTFESQRLVFSETDSEGEKDEAENVSLSTTEMESQSAEGEEQVSDTKDMAEGVVEEVEKTIETQEAMEESVVEMVPDDEASVTNTIPIEIVTEKREESPNLEVESMESSHQPKPCESLAAPPLLSSLQASETQQTFEEETPKNIEIISPDKQENDESMVEISSSADQSKICEIEPSDEEGSPNIPSRAQTDTEKIEQSDEEQKQISPDIVSSDTSEDTKAQETKRQTEIMPKLVSSPIHTDAMLEPTVNALTEHDPESSLVFVASEDAPEEPDTVSVSKKVPQRRSVRKASLDEVTPRTPTRRSRRNSLAIEEVSSEPIATDVSAIETPGRMQTRSVSRNSMTGTPEPHRTLRRRSTTPSREVILSSSQQTTEEVFELQLETSVSKSRRTPTREMRSLRESTPLRDEETSPEKVLKRLRRTPTREAQVKETDTGVRVRGSSESHDSVPPSPLRRVSLRLVRDSSPDSVASGSSEILSTSHYALRSRSSPAIQMLQSSDISPPSIRTRTRQTSEASSGKMSPVPSTSTGITRRSSKKATKLHGEEDQNENEEGEPEHKVKGRKQRRSSSTQPTNLDSSQGSIDMSILERPPSRTRRGSTADLSILERPPSRTRRGSTADLSIPERPPSRTRRGSLVNIRETEEGGSDSDQSIVSVSSVASEPVRKRQPKKRDLDSRDESEEDRQPVLKRQRAVSEEPQKATRRSLRPRKSILLQPPELEPIPEADSQVGSQLGASPKGSQDLSEDQRVESSTDKSGKRVSRRTRFRIPKKRQSMQLRSKDSRE